MTGKFIGKCPICQKDLILGDDNQLRCGSHYKISVAVFNQAWENFENSDEFKQRLGLDTPIDALMKTLLDNNTALVKETDEPENEKR